MSRYISTLIDRALSKATNHCNQAISHSKFRKISNSSRDEQELAACGLLVTLRRTEKSKEDDHLF